MISMILNERMIIMLTTKKMFLLVVESLNVGLAIVSLIRLVNRIQKEE